MESADLHILPRAALLGEVVFREPTIGSEIWLRQVSRLFNLDDVETYIQVRALSLSMPQDELPDANNRELVIDALNGLLEKIKGYTLRQLMNALYYAIQGNDPSAGEAMAQTRDHAFDHLNEDEGEFNDINDYCYEMGVLNKGILYKLGTIEEMEGMTLSRLLGLIEYKRAMKNGSKNKHEDVRKLGEYYAVLEEIKEAHKKTEDEAK